MKQKKIDINNASVEELTTVSGIGESLANKIIEKRPYHVLNDLVKVSGINEVKLASLSPYMTIDNREDKSIPTGQIISKQTIEGKKPITTLGNTEAFVFLEDRNERQDALLIIFGGFILGLVLLLLRRSQN